MAQEKTKRLVKETGWFALGNFGSKILTMLLVPFYTSILSTAEYGTIDILLTTLTLLIPVLTLELANGVFRFALDRAYDTRRVATSCFAVTAVSWVGLLALYPLLIAVLPSVAEYWWYFFFIYVSGSISTVLSSFMKGVDKSHIFALQGILYTFVFVVCNLAFLLWLRLGVRGYLLSRICANTAAVVFMTIWGRAAAYVSPGCFDWDLLKEILRFSAPLIPAAIAWWVMSSIDRYMLLYMCGKDANGLYGVAHKLPSVVTVLTNFFISAWQISAIRDKDDDDAAVYTSRMYNMLFILGTALCFGMVIGSRILGRIMFAKDFFVAWTMTPSLSVATVFSTFSLFIGAQFTAEKRSDLHLKSNLIAMGTNVVLNYILIRIFGVNGAAYGTMVSYFSVLLYRQVKVRELMDFRIPTGKVYTACGLLMAAAMITSLQVPLWYLWSAAAAAAVYLLYRGEYHTLARELSGTLRRKLKI